MRVEPYGGFLEIAPGKDGLLHVSEIDWDHVESVEQFMKLGDEIEVKITDIDREGRVRLSRKELLPKPEGWVERTEFPDKPSLVVKLVKTLPSNLDTPDRVPSQT